MKADDKQSGKERTLADWLNYTFRSGKNPKWLYYSGAVLREAMPGWVLRKRLPALLREAKERPDWDYIQDRVDYYNRLPGRAIVGPGAQPLRLHAPGDQSVYYHDSVRYTDYFPQDNLWNFEPGDNTKILPWPAVTKSRPIDREGISNANDVLLKLDRVRHFIFLNDRLDFEQKMPRAIFRSKLGNPRRVKFMEMYYGSDICDCGDVSRRPVRPEWGAPKMPLPDHLRYQFILSLEGNDVASNLKWVMSTNSLAVTPPMVYETWFMEGRLRAGEHYVEIRPDFADLPEKIDWYSKHPDEARAVSRAANRWVDQFRDKRREFLISLLVLDKYFG